MQTYKTISFQAQSYAQYKFYVEHLTNCKLTELYQQMSLITEITLEDHYYAIKIIFIFIRLLNRNCKEKTETL